MSLKATNIALSASALFLLALAFAGPITGVAQEVRKASVIADEPLDEALSFDLQVTVPEPQIPISARDHAVLGGLNKITARVSTIEIPLNQEMSFGTLSITARTCAKRPPTEPPETTAFLEISDATMADGEGDFTGWMFASSPAVSALEHPVYDIWVLDCNILSGAASAGN